MTRARRWKRRPKTWIIGKPPEKGGDEDEYSVYVQRPMSYMARLRFFSLVSRTIAEAMKAGAQLELPGEGGIRQRVAAMRESDLTDASNFVQLAFQLIAYAPDFMVDCYLIWLDVPMKDRGWFRLVANQPYDPERGLYGISDDDNMEMVEIFIDQNYETIREFFTGKLPALYRRALKQENKKASADRASSSVPSKR
jgi:hypothetical protein